MSEQFRSLRHLTAYVDQEHARFAQLKDAIAQVSGLIDSLPERKREVEALKQQADEWQQKIAKLEEGHKLLMDQCRNQRAETQGLIQKEQQERMTAREAFKTEQQQWQSTVAKAREELNSVQREIQQKSNELERLQQDLAATVKAVLRR
jgi:predicted  nucleic acid-binding Zn-ribbon protein